MIVKKRVLWYAVFWIAVGLYLICVMLNSQSPYKMEEFVIICTFFATIFVYSFAFARDNIELLYPIHFVTVLYLCVFIFCPIYLIEVGRTTCNGAYIMDGSIKATIIFFMSYVAFIFGYLSIRTTSFDDYKPMVDSELSKGYRQRIIILCLCIWAFGMLINLYYLLRSGMSLSYIISLGSQGLFNETGEMSDVSFVSNFGYFMVIPWLYILHYSHCKILKLGITFFTFVLYLVRGFRFIIVIMVIAFALCYYRKKMKRPS